VVASRTFVATEPAPSSDTEAVIPAFDRAAARLLGDIVPWVLSNV
jgi:ABC-type uncharacterized transport system auxiliary subunit